MRVAGRALLGVATAAYLVVLGMLTLGGQPAGPNGVMSTLADWFAGSPLTSWITYPVLEFTANVVLFLPAGAIWVLWFGARHWWLGIVAGLALSGAIEATQALLLADRVADARDLVANTLGALLGAVGVRTVVRARGRATASRAS